MIATTRDLTLNRPAELVIVESRTDTDFAQPFRLPDVRDAQGQLTAFLELELERRSATAVPSARPLTRGQLLFLQIGAVLLLSFAVVGFAVASARTF